MLMSISGDTLEAPLLCAGYRQTDGVYDEMSAAPGVLRPHWDTFIGSMSALGGEELARRWKIARQRIRENGVTYNVYGDPLGMDRPWNLDSIPLLIPPSEWNALEAGLIQRARLLNCILADLYGPQQLLRGGLLPPAHAAPLQRAYMRAHTRGAPARRAGARRGARPAGPPPPAPPRAGRGGRD